MRLRAHLITLVLAALTPVLLFCVVMVVLFWRQERAAIERGMRETVRAAVMAVEREIQTSTTAMEALAASPALEAGNLPEFYNQARRVSASRTAWHTIVLLSPEGEQLVNTLMPLGTDLAPVGKSDYLSRVLQSGRAAVSGLMVDALTSNPIVAVAVPVRRDGGVRYVVVSVLDAGSLKTILEEQQLPDDWLAAIFDQRGFHIAGTRNSEKFVGQPAPPEFAARAADTPESSFHAVTSDGERVYTALSRSPLTGWTVALAVPASAVEGSLQRSLAAVASAGALFLALGIALALRLGSRIAGPIADLAHVAEQVGRGAIPPRVASPVTEVNEVSRALEEAGALLRERSTERETATAAVRDSEERLRFALQAAQVGAWEWDTRTGRVTWSATLEAIHGLEPGTFAGTFEAYQRGIHLEDRPRVVDALSRSLEAGGDHDAEYRIVRPDGSVRWVHGRGRVFRDANGQPQRMSGICFDITARKQAEAQLAAALAGEQGARAEAEQLYADAQAANRAKDEFLATLSHELRTPLTAVMGWARLLRSPDTDEATAARAIEVIERNTRLQVQLVSDLLDVSRIITGKLRLEVRPVDLTTVVEAACEAVRTAAEAKRINIIIDLDPELLPIQGDPDRLQQVVWNLLSNAVKFTPDGGRVDINVTRGRGHVEIRVRDTGQGIRPGFLPYVFDRFRQGDSTAARMHGGLGLGLAIVRHLVELHGGTVEVTSEGQDRGATFTVRLPETAPLLSPVSEVPSRSGRSAGAADGDRAAAEPALDGIRVLLVEDDPDQRELVGRLLRQHGARVTAVASAADARARLASAQPDVVVSDIALPEEDGYALIRDLRNRRGDAVPAVALTAYARDEDRARATAAGYDMHVSKPADSEVLVRAVASLTGRVGRM